MIGHKYARAKDDASTTLSSSSIIIYYYFYNIDDDNDCCASIIHARLGNAPMWALLLKANPKVVGVRNVPMQTGMLVSPMVQSQSTSAKADKE